MKLGVIGAGAWGTALAQVAVKGGEVLLWARNPVLAAAINATHANEPYLPGVALDPTIRATSDLGALADCDALLSVTPAQHMREILGRVEVGERPLLLCSKGIEAGTMALMSDAAAEVCPDAPIAVLSGPTFASEVARGLPTAITLACTDERVAAQRAARIAQPGFRPYRSTDVVGAEIGGAVKNVLAIACGVVEGARLGKNARAALIARGFAEMTRFGLARGAKARTLAGLSGLGDLVLTCSSEQSRNFSLGVGLGEGRSIDELMRGRRTVAEGAATAPVLVQAADAVGVEMPICAAVAELLGGRLDTRKAVERLLARPLRDEIV
jgi:glycerol-3-phosphate dehydrogenase (NAD(P)+)